MHLSSNPYSHRNTGGLSKRLKTSDSILPTPLRASNKVELTPSSRKSSGSQFSVMNTSSSRRYTHWVPPTTSQKHHDRPQINSRLANLPHLPNLHPQRPLLTRLHGVEPGEPQQMQSPSRSPTVAANSLRMKNMSVDSSTTPSLASTIMSSTTTRLYDNSSGRDEISCLMSSSTLKLPGSETCTYSLLGHISQSQLSLRPEQTKRVCTLATEPERYAGSSIEGTAMAVNGSTSALHAASPDMGHTTAEKRPGSDRKMTESSTSCSFVAHFWKAAVDFVSNRLGVYEQIEERSETEGENVGRVENPSLSRFTRGFGFRDKVELLRSRTTSFTESDDPLPRPASTEFENPPWHTIQENPHLFRVQTPITADHLEALSKAHSDQPSVKSVVVGLKEGFWPWASTRPSDDFSITWNNLWASLPSEKEQDFVNTQGELEAQSQPFGTDLLPGMHSTPAIAVPKPRSEALRFVAHQFTGEFDHIPTIPTGVQ
ncbi:hypothetical protein F5051DRAFT_390865 [Lentinula edodes]|nr:hypothetical protein F5051DRAFT_390865 [Lentinula edodes]